MARGQGRLTLLDKPAGETGPCVIPAVTITRSDLLSDLEALTYVGHSRVGLADTALELTVEILIVEVQLHRSRSSCSGRDGPLVKP